MIEESVGALFGAIDALFRGLRRGVRRLVRAFVDGPLTDAVVLLLIGLTGLGILHGRESRGLDRVAGFVERVVVVLAMLAMTALAFNEYLQREATGLYQQFGWGDVPALWQLDGQMNVALLLMVVVGFLGASIATQERKHLAVDAIDRVLSPAPARFVKRVVALVAAGLCYQFGKGSWSSVFEHSQDTFEGATVWGWMVGPVNWATTLIPGEKFGPGTEYATAGKWEDAMFERGYEWDQLPVAFSYVSAGDRFPLWIPLCLLTCAFFLMALRFLAHVISPPAKSSSAEAPLDEADPAPTWSEMREALVGRSPYIRLARGLLVGTGAALLTWGFVAEPDAIWVGALLVGFAWLPVYTSVTVLAALAWLTAWEAPDLPLLGAPVAWYRGFSPVIAVLVAQFAFAVVVHGIGGRLSAPEPSPIHGNRRPADVVLAGLFPGALVAMGLGVWLGKGTLILIASIVVVLLGAPLFVGVGVGTLAAWSLIRDGGADTVVIDMFEATKKQELLAIPFFVLAGNLMTRGTISAKIIAFARACIGFLPGGLGVGAVLACAFFAAISGSSPVTVIAIGTIVFPMLLKDGYSERYSLGLLTTAGGLGIIIPPSIPMIVYAIVVGQNPRVGAIDTATLFKAGILPGLFIALVLIVYSLFLWWPRPGVPSPLVRTKFAGIGPWATNLGRTTFIGLPSLMLPVIILGGIYGWFDLQPLGIPLSINLTVTEAAAVAVVYALLVELLLHRELKWKDVPSVVNESAVMMGSLFLILVIAISLNRFFVFEQVPDRATDFVLSYVDSKFTFLLVVNLFLLALGCVMDILSAILIVAPLLAPIAASYGVNGIHFGIMFIVNLEIGYLTPPMGINLFVASTVFERPLLEVIRAVLPFLLVMLFCLAVIVFAEPLSTFLIAEGAGVPPALSGN